jgi:hypothetical protein
VLLPLLLTGAAIAYAVRRRRRRVTIA